MPFPREETTPPVMKMYRAMGAQISPDSRKAFRPGGRFMCRTLLLFGSLGRGLGGRGRSWGGRGLGLDRGRGQDRQSVGGVVRGRGLSLRRGRLQGRGRGSRGRRGRGRRGRRRQALLLL